MISPRMCRRWTKHERRRGWGDAADRAAHFIATIRARFPEALVPDTDILVARPTNDPKDRHVLAAAIVGRARVIVTNNLRHFPTTALAPHALEAQSPDTFLADLVDLHHDRLCTILEAQGAALRQQRTFEATLAHLRPQLPAFIAAIERGLRGRPVP